MRNSTYQPRRAIAAAATVLLAVGAAVLAVAGAMGSEISSATFAGGTGTSTSGGTIYAKQGQSVTLTVTTDGSTRCVSLAGAHTGVQTSGTGKTSWTFPLTAGAGDGVRAVTVTSGNGFNGNNVCTVQTRTSSASYVADNTGPAVTGTVSPSPNAAEWNKSDASVTWSATDAGAGVAGTPTPATDSVTANTSGVVKTATATDRVGNFRSGSITVKLDKIAPTFNFTRSPQANANGWNNTNVTLGFNCADALSGIKSCTGGGTQILSQEGTNLQVAGRAVDNADNEATNPVTGVNIDKTAPTLTGEPTRAPNSGGWYDGDVKVRWTAADSRSGLDGPVPGDSTVTGEGANLSATETVRDLAGNATSSTVEGIRIDRTAPTTAATAPSGWSATAVTLELEPNDALSGVAATHFRVDGGATQSGTEVNVGGDGVHVVELWSVDRAGNAESPKTLTLRVDGTAPQISHMLGIPANANGWHKADVSVTFVCSDATSGLASCGPDRVVSDEGVDQHITGEAIDNAGNTAVDHAFVSLDTTAPAIEAAADRAPNGAGWYDADVDVSFTCADLLSGIDACPGAKTVGEGADQSVSATGTDAAGNETTASLSGVDVDKTAPSLSGAPTTDPNGAGWYDGDVTVEWTASDALSGLDGDTPAPSVVEGEGDNLSAAASVTDRAGHTTTRTLDGIKIDRTAPVTSATVADPLESGWYASAVDVTLDALDPVSGVAETYYSVDAGQAQRYQGEFAFASKGVHTIRFWSVDRAGNVEDHSDAGHALMLKIDGIAPTITGSRIPGANAFGWNNTQVDVTFDCTDAESGIAGCTGPIPLTNEGAGQEATGTAVDNAGNSAHTTVRDIHIDLTAPSLAGAPTTPANAAGWYDGDVTIRWTGVDGLSGIDPGTAPADSKITGEGAALGAGPATIADKAGNSATASVSGIKIDRTPPAIAGKPTTSPNAAGWYNGDVVVDFTCTDALSGVAACPTSKVAKLNGAAHSVTSDPATDLAGNQAPGVTVGGLNIDSLPPQTLSDNQCTKANGWCTGSSATVVLTAGDQAGLSGVKEIHYSIDGGAEQIAAGATKTLSVPLDGSGNGTVEYYAVDVAGNRERANAVALKWDNIAPTVTHSLTPSPNATGWNVGDVTVRFGARDDDKGSGVDTATITPDVLVQAETAGRVVDGFAKDVAGNVGADSATVKLDRTAPVVTGAVVAGTKGSGAWYTGPVKVAFTCSDALAGIAVCPDPVTLTENGTGQSVSGTATDNAGNTATVKVTGIDIDLEKPVVKVTGLQDGAIYALGAVPAGACNATDAVSGASDCAVTVTGGLANGVGTFSFVARATDNAGNAGSVTGTFRVIYRFDGFLQPINDTAHQVGASTSVFKAASTVPAKFQLKKANGAVVQATAAPVWLTPAKGVATTAPVDEALYAAPAESDSVFRYDPAAQQYAYNWGTVKTQAGSYWRIGVKLDDGQIYHVNAGLR